MSFVLAGVSSYFAWFSYSLGIQTNLSHLYPSQYHEEGWEMLSYFSLKRQRQNTHLLSILFSTLNRYYCASLHTESCGSLLSY